MHASGDRPGEPALDPAALIRRWGDAVGRLGSAGPAVDAAGGEVLACYAQAGRAYHTVEHLGEVVGALEWLCGSGGVPPAVEFAAWFHDAVYDPRAAPGRNEEASAVYGGEVLGRLRVPPVVVDEAARLVRTTATHAVEVSDEAGAVLADADLWILGSPPERYRRYAAAVRREYGFLSDNDWRTGRSALIETFARRRRLYVTDRAHRALDAGARRNLAWELAALGGGEAEP
jgi:predicted metal-dependent HD superfamily phosphohydrolase